MSAAREFRRASPAGQVQQRGHGGVVAATWLIGLGLIFLIQQALDIPWAEAWPMFIILAGAAGLVSVLLGFGWHGAWFVGLGWPLLLVAVGTLQLLSTTGTLGIEPAELAGWWPLALIVLGLWFLVAAAIPRPRLGESSLELPLDGAAEAFVKIGFGGGQLTVRAGRAGALLTGEFENVVARVRETGPGRVEISPQSPVAWPWWDRTPDWRLGLPTDVPVELQVDSGAARTWLDLKGVQLRRLKISTGASDTRVRLPRSAGHSIVRAEGGAAALAFEVPAGVAARIRSQMALGTTRVDESHFPKTGRGWESPDYEGAANRVEIDIQGGVGSVTVTAID